MQRPGETVLNFKGFLLFWYAIKQVLWLLTRLYYLCVSMNSFNTSCLVKMFVFFF